MEKLALIVRFFYFHFLIQNDIYLNEGNSIAYGFSGDEKLSLVNLGV